MSKLCDCCPDTFCSCCPDTFGKENLWCYFQPQICFSGCSLRWWQFCRCLITPCSWYEGDRTNETCFCCLSGLIADGIQISLDSCDICKSMPCFTPVPFFGGCAVSAIFASLTSACAPFESVRQCCMCSYDCKRNLSVMIKEAGDRIVTVQPTIIVGPTVLNLIEVSNKLRTTDV